MTFKQYLENFHFHYEEAEKHLKHSGSAIGEDMNYHLQASQAHALLAQAAATMMHTELVGLKE